MSDRLKVQRKKPTSSDFINSSLVTPVGGFNSQPDMVLSQNIPVPQSHDISKISLRPQAKLTVSQPGDFYEQQADKVAQQVMNMGEPIDYQKFIQRETVPQEEEDDLQMKSVSHLITPIVQIEEIPEEEEEELLQMKSSGNFAIQQEEILEEEDIQTKPSFQRATDPSLQVEGNIESRLSSSKGGGSSLADDVRGFMEPRFGTKFNNVRVHTGEDAVQMNRELGAQAFTHGSDIYFGTGKSPGNNELTAHELTHVVQQTGKVQSKLIQCQDDFKLPPVPKYQLTPPSLFQPPDPDSPYQTGAIFKFKIKPQTRLLLKNEVQKQLNLNAINNILNLQQNLLLPIQSDPVKSPAPETTSDPSAPKSATPEDLLKAVDRAVSKAVPKLQQQLIQKVNRDLKRLGTGEQVGVVSGLAVVGLGNILLDARIRELAFSKLSGKVLPVPDVSWLYLETNITGNNMMFGAHVDVGSLLPAILGFKPSLPQPIGNPPTPQPFVPGEPVQRSPLSLSSSNTQEMALDIIQEQAQEKPEFENIFNSNPDNRSSIHSFVDVARRNTKLENYIYCEEVDRFDRLNPERKDSNPSDILNQLNPAVMKSLGVYCNTNCPATAAAVDNYLATGEIKPAHCNKLAEDAGYDISDDKFTSSMKWGQALSLIRQRTSKHGSFVVVEGDRGEHPPSRLTQWHYFTIVNIRGKRFVVDAFGSGQVTSDVNSYERSLKTKLYRLVVGRFQVKPVR